MKAHPDFSVNRQWRLLEPLRLELLVVVVVVCDRPILAPVVGVGDALPFLPVI